tara:strand:+ start:654 stop:761 length:108 start_codon:yes stop_codon:yes gene_type:complete
MKKYMGKDADDMFKILSFAGILAVLSCLMLSGYYV